MPLEVSREKAAWILARWSAVLMLVLIALALVPPGTLPYPPTGTYSDAVISHWPNAYLLRQSVWREGQWPFWNPTRMLGQPFAANPLSKVWYPPQWLVLVLPPTLHLNLLWYAHMAWLGLGMIAWARAERLHPLAGFFAALAWGLNPKLIGHLGAGHFDIVYALAWVPWLLLSVQRVAASSTLRRGLTLGVVAALLALADPRIAFYMLPVGVAYALLLIYLLRVRETTSDVLTSRRGSSWQPWGLAIVLFFLLTAVQSIPLLALSPYLTRASIAAQEAAEYSLPLRYLLGLLIPDVGGLHEWMTYVGLPVLVLALLPLRRGPRRLAALVWWGLAGLALLWSLGKNGPLFMPVARHIPFVGWFRIPSRAWFILVLSLVLLGSWGLNGLLSYGLGRYGQLAAMALAFSGLVWFFVATFAMPGLPPVISGTGLALLCTGLGVWVGGGGLANMIPASPGRIAFLGCAFLVLVLAFSLLLVDLSLVEARSMEAIEKPEQALVDMIDPACGLVYSPSFELIGPGAVQAGIATLHGVDPFQLAWSSETITGAAGTVWEAYSVIVPPMPPSEKTLQYTQPNYDELAALGTCWIVAKYPLEGKRSELSKAVGETYVYRMQPGGELVPGATVLPSTPITGPRPVKTNACFDVVSTGSPVWAIFPQSWAPGWRAWVDGRSVPVERVGGIFVGFRVATDGCHEISVAYRPVADFIGLGVSGATVFGLAVGTIVCRQKRMACA